MMNGPQNCLKTSGGDYKPAAPPAASPAALAALAVPAECAGLRVDVALARVFPQHSRSRLQGWLKAGRVRLDGALADLKYKVRGNERIALDLPALPDAAAPQAEAMALSIVFEDAEIMVINKPVGLVVHPGNGNWSGTLLNALLHHAPPLAGLPRAGIVHRLDKDTSGLMVVAKTLEAQTHLTRQLQARSVKRHYLALARGALNHDGVVDAPIVRHPTQRTKMAVAKTQGTQGTQGARGQGRQARTHYFVREHFAGATLLECHLDTGRTHQIRVHMAALGHALVGDRVYAKGCTGVAALDEFPRQALHAWRLSLVHPASAKTLSWEAPLPEDFAGLLARLARGA